MPSSRISIDNAFFELRVRSTRREFFLLNANHSHYIAIAKLNFKNSTAKIVPLHELIARVTSHCCHAMALLMHLTTNIGHSYFIFLENVEILIHKACAQPFVTLPSLSLSWPFFRFLILNGSKLHLFQHSYIQSSSNIFLSTVEKPLAESSSQYFNLSLSDTGGAFSGYSIWKTGLLWSMNVLKSRHSSQSTHCSLTDHCILDSTCGRIWIEGSRSEGDHKRKGAE